MRRRILIPLCVVAAISMGALPHSAIQPPSTVTPATTSNSAEAQTDKLVDEFKTKIYPLLTRDEGGCIDCHSTDTQSDLIFSGNAEEDLHMLIDGKYLGESGPDTLFGRLTSENKKLRMPEEGDPWTESEIELFATFLKSVKQQQKTNGAAVDERFPRALLQPYRGPASQVNDNLFISYWQLKSKIAVIFEDDWIRQDRDLFAENIALFGGADFKTRFNETREPNAAFLTALEMLAKDVAHMAFQRKRGPFAQVAFPKASPLEADQPNAAYQAAITHLFEKILFRSPTKDEVDVAYELVRNIYRSSDLIASRNHTLAFELTVHDPSTGLDEKRVFAIPVTGDQLEIHQQVVDQSQKPKAKNKPILREVIGPDVLLKPGNDQQRLVIHNVGTQQNVSFAGVEILDVHAQGDQGDQGDQDDQDDQAKPIKVPSSDLQIDGAWQLNQRSGKRSLEDQNNHKGKSTITVPLKVKKEGKYRVTLLWRANPGNANNVLVELFAQGAGNRLASPMEFNIPSRGEAHYVYDCGNDTVAFFQPSPAFLFDKESYVEISNRGTRRRVTAGAVELIQRSDPRRRFLIDSRQAKGNENWSQYNEGQFKAYNVKGKKLHDNNKKKGELSLRYELVFEVPAESKKPETAKPKQDDKDSKASPKTENPIQEKPLKEKPAQKKPRKGWDPKQFYSARIYYPGKVNHESQVPVLIKAAKSSPIIQLKHPQLAKSDAQIRLDASQSYTVQHSELQFSWRQLSGTPVNISNPKQPLIEFITPRPDIKQFAWSSLAAALMRHPDFLFTRPPSLFASKSSIDRQKLQLVKIALDLVGRPPTASELKKLKDGTKLTELVDNYLDSSEFRDYYFHRIRLMLESQGTELEDEPARLWSFVAFNDRPFQEILIGEYTVDREFKKKNRPAHHGKTGLLTTKGFIHGKPGLPHYNYAAQVSMLFLGYVYEVPDEIVDQREGVTALGTTDPNSVCYSCHKILTPLAFQRLNWADDGKFRTKDENDQLIDASDRGSVAEYPFAGKGLEAFATQAVRKERFIRAMINTHVHFYFGRPLRHRQDERVLYKRLWDHVHQNEFKIRELIREIVNSPEYLNGGSKPVSTE